MLWLRACPRCGGDLGEEDFGADMYITCLQCGGILTVEQDTALRLAARRQRMTKAAA